MKIITGIARGMNLETLEGDATRPTSQRVKEAVFSMIQFDIEGASVLDLFAGSGQLGLEALSRGAKKATFSDSSRDAVDIVMRNAKKSRLFDKCRISTCTYDAMRVYTMWKVLNFLDFIGRDIDFPCQQMNVYIFVRYSHFAWNYSNRCTDNYNEQYEYP